MALHYIRKLAIRLWLIALLGGVWWVASAGSSNVYFPPLAQILETFRSDWLTAKALPHLLPSLGKLVLGFGIAAIAGVAFGTLLGLTPRLRAAFEPVMQFLRALPPPVLLPIGLLVFGITGTMNVFIIVLGAVWPTVLNTADGVRSLEPILRDVARSYRLTLGQRIFTVVMPSASPQILSGLRVTLQLSIILIVVSEMVAAVRGVGFYVLNSQQTFAVNETWAGTLLLGIIGFLATAIFSVFERRLLAWQRGMHGARTA